MVSGKYTCLENKTLFIVGQDLDTVRDFLSSVIPNPSGTTSYTGIFNNSNALGGLDSTVDYGSGNVCASAQAALAPDSFLVLGLCLKDALEDIVLHKCDSQIDRLGEWIRNFGRPVFLRIGYEFDGPWNNYDPEYYKLAFTWIVSRLRFRGVRNFVSVWQSATLHSFLDLKGKPVQIERDYTKWYPGDSVVDWLGTSYFELDKEAHDGFLNFARAKNKPVMIAESAPKTYDLEQGHRINGITNECLCSNLTGKDIWNEWFSPFFKYVTANRDVVRAVAYINTPWKKQKMWNCGEHGYWGDSRVEVDEYIKEKFIKELSNDALWSLSCPNFISKIDDRV
eukprot:g4882.t1